MLRAVLFQACTFSGLALRTSLHIIDAQSSSTYERNLMEKDTNEYETPRIEDHGSLEELTAGQSEGKFTDHYFPAGTPKEDLTFSTP
jgi:hypothetical protein